MFGDHFYHATMRKSVAVFGTLFNNIKVVRKKAGGGVLNQVKVPLAYGPKQKFWMGGEFNNSVLRSRVDF